MKPKTHVASRLPPTPYVCVYVYKFCMSCWSFYVAISIFLPFSSSFSLSLYLSFSDVSFLSLSRDLSLCLWPKIAPTWHHNGTKNFPNRAQMGPRAAQMEPKWRQDGVKTAKKQEQRANATKKWAACQDVAPFWPKIELTWPQLGLQNGAKMPKKSIPKSIIIVMPLGIDF